MCDHNGTELCECVTANYAIEALYVHSQINILPRGRWKREVAVQLLSLNSLQGLLARAKTVASCHLHVSNSWSPFRFIAYLHKFVASRQILLYTKARAARQQARLHADDVLLTNQVWELKSGSGIQKNRRAVWLPSQSAFNNMRSLDSWSRKPYTAIDLMHWCH